MAYRVIVIEDDPNMLEDIVATLRRSPDFEVAATYKNANAAINPSGMFKPNLFFFNAEDDENLDMVPDFVKKFPGAYILGTMNQWDPLIAQKASEGGATGCILKPFTAKDILEHLHSFSGVIDFKAAVNHRRDEDDIGNTANVESKRIKTRR